MPSDDPTIWQQRMALNLSLSQALTMHGLLLLALRHPGVATETPMTREVGEDAVALLSRLLVHQGGLTADELRGCLAVEAEASGMTWEDLARATVRLEARIAALGFENPDTPESHMRGQAAEA